jgi:hypothetical protein
MGRTLKKTSCGFAKATIPPKAQEDCMNTSLSRPGVEAAKYNVPRIAEGKYLKFAYETLKENNLLETATSELNQKICPECDIKSLCVRQETEGKLSPFCLDGMLAICFKG